MANQKPRPAGLVAIDREMSRQHGDALASFAEAAAMAARVAASLDKTGRLLLLGMGGSHAVNRAVEPLYRALGIDAIAIPLSEQLGEPLTIGGRTVLMTSQSGESAEVVRWFTETGGHAETFGLTLEAGSFLARTAPSLVGVGGTELAFAATRSLTVTLALHLAILAALGEHPSGALVALQAPEIVDIGAALRALAEVDTVVTSGRRLQGVAEALALGLTELSRRPWCCFAARIRPQIWSRRWQSRLSKPARPSSSSIPPAKPQWQARSRSLLGQRPAWPPSLQCCPPPNA